jgi:hypothetical protein
MLGQPFLGWRHKEVSSCTPSVAPFESTCSELVSAYVLRGEVEEMVVHGLFLS